VLTHHQRSRFRRSDGLTAPPELSFRRALQRIAVMFLLLLTAAGSGCVSADIFARAFAEDLAGTAAGLFQLRLLESLP